MDTETNRITPPVELQQLVIFPTAEQHTGTVVFLHVSSYSILTSFVLSYLAKGLGQYTQSWLPFIQSMAARLPSIKWILPQA